MNNSSYTIEKRWMGKFIPIWVAQIFSLLGSGLVQFALVWWITKETGSAVYLGIGTFVAILPEVLLAPFAGALVDRYNRRIIMILADGLVALFTLGLAILFALGVAQIWHIFVVMFLRSLGGSFHWSAMQSSTSLMVPEKHLSRVAGITHALHGSLNIAAPPLGALLMGLLQFYQVIAVDVVTAFLAILPLLFIRIPQPVRSDEDKAVTPRVIWQDVVAGFRYLKNWKGLFLLTLIAAFFYFLMTPAFTLIPLMVTEHFKAGVWELSFIESAFGIGLVAGGLILGVWGGFKNKVVTISVGAIGSGVATLLFGLASPQGFWLGASAILLLGIMQSICGGPFLAVIQSRVTPEMQGRVMGSTNSLMTFMMPVSMLVMTPVAELLGLRIWYWVGGILTILIGVSTFFIPTIMNMDAAQGKAAQAEITHGLPETP